MKNKKFRKWTKRFPGIITAMKKSHWINSAKAVDSIRIAPLNEAALKTVLTANSYVESDEEGLPFYSESSNARLFSVAQDNSVKEDEFISWHLAEGDCIPLAVTFAIEEGRKINDKYLVLLKEYEKKEFKEDFYYPSNSRWETIECKHSITVYIPPQNSRKKLKNLSDKIVKDDCKAHNPTYCCDLGDVGGEEVNVGDEKEELNRLDFLKQKVLTFLKGVFKKG